MVEKMERRRLGGLDGSWDIWEAIESFPENTDKKIKASSSGTES